MESASLFFRECEHHRLFSYSGTDRSYAWRAYMGWVEDDGRCWGNAGFLKVFLKGFTWIFFGSKET